MMGHKSCISFVNEIDNPDKRHHEIDNPDKRHHKMQHCTKVCYEVYHMIFKSIDHQKLKTKANA